MSRRLTRERDEALEQRTATAEVLKLISRSTFDLQTVLDALVASAVRLCEAERGVVFRREGEFYKSVAYYNYPREFQEFHESHPITPGRGTAVGRAALEGKTVQIVDILADPEYTFTEAQKLGRSRATLAVPLLREATPIGALGLQRTEPRPYTPKQIELVETFAAQAVIAIENTRLFNETQEALERQTATADILKVIASSPSDVQPVFDAIVSSAARLCGADKGVIFQRDGEVYGLAATYGFSPEFIAYANENPIKADLSTTTGRVSLGGKTIHIPDVLADPDCTASEYQRLRDYRTTLGVPLLREGVPIGSFSLTRAVAQPFTPRQIELVETFADQAVIAIENARLFAEVQDRTRELSQSLDDLRTAQDRLVQTEKLASLGQLTAGIAHEIKNPLNFVNNFAALSAELTDELNDVLKQAEITEKIRAEVDELTGLLKDNLQKVVQHGQRADSIVKNMLLHSREGGGEHRPSDINALIDESLNLAYHGARAEKPDFNVTLERDFDAGAGMVDVFPQEITRVFLNLVSNGFYAVTNRKAESGTGFEPTVIACTKDRGEHVEIRIRDNGTGIPVHVKEKMFNPFFTTKPAGEGTGLGLSMSHDIIVKQHGGTIEVVTEPGQFTEFTVILPRTNNFSNKSRG